MRFLSCEPLLGPINLTVLNWQEIAGRRWRGRFDDGPPIDWVITGGESGPHARPSHPDWFRSLRDQCAAAGVPFHFKQWGAWCGQPGAITRAVLELEPKRVHRFDGPDNYWSRSYRVGKLDAGRLLDGVEHNGMPKGGGA